MNYNNILICVDDKCEWSRKVIDNWESLLIHQQLGHKILTLNQLYEKLKQNQEFQSSEEFQFYLEEDLKENQNYIDDVCSDFRDKCLQAMNIFFNEINEMFTLQFSKEVNQRLDQLNINLEAFSNILFNIPYQQKVLESLQEIQSKSYINNISNQLCEQLDYQFQLFYKDLNIFLLNQKEFLYQKPNVQEQEKEPLYNFDFSPIPEPNHPDNLHKNFETTEQIVEELPLKNYKSTIAQLNNSGTLKNVINVPQSNKLSMKIDEQIQTAKKSFTQTIIYSDQILLQKKQLDIPIITPIVQEKQNYSYQNNDSQNYQQKSSKMQKPKTEEAKFFQTPNFNYLNHKVLFFSKKHMYGDLTISDNDKVVSTDSEGFIIFHGFIDTKSVTTLSLLVNKRHKDYEIEIGVVDWDTFKFPKLYDPQPGIYGYNNYGGNQTNDLEIFDNGQFRQKKQFFDDNQRISVTYGRQKHIMVYQSEKYNNQAICLQNAKKTKLTFYAFIYKAKISIV